MIPMTERVTQAEAFAAWLRETLAARNVTQSDLARRMGVARAHVSRWAGGTVRPEPASCRDMAKALGIDPLDVMAAAGWVAEIDDTRQQVIELVRYLPEDKIADALQFLRFLTQDRRGE